MKVPDVNILVYAHRPDSIEHEWAARWLLEQLAGDEQLGLTDAVISGFIRVSTNPRAFLAPTPISIALEQVEGLLEHPGVLRISAGPRHWDVFAGLCRRADARGNLVSDAAHAAVAIEHDATWVSLDRDFARFPGLRWEVPSR